MRIRGLSAGLLFVVVAAAGCGDMWGDLFGSKRGAEGSGSGGACTAADKNDATLTQIILSPPACSSAATCPCGSYCSSTVSGVCVVDCRSDDECARGKTCSAYGQCVGASSSDGGLPANPSCPRDMALLLSPSTLQRHCKFDDECPYGSRCDNSSGLCAVDCLTDSSCPLVNGVAQVCSCLGQCVVPDGPIAKPSGSVPTLVISQESFILPPTSDPPPASPDWGDTGVRQFSVSLTSPVLIGSGETAPLVITPDANTEVLCPTAQDGGTASFTANPCTVALGSLQTSGSSYATATQIVQMRPVATGQGTPARKWEARVGGTGITGAPKTVVVKYASDPISTSTRPAGSNWIDSDTAPTTFQGAGSVDFATPTGAHMKLPISGRTDPVWQFVLNDASKTLTTSGKMMLHDPRYQATNLDGTDTNDFIDFNPASHINGMSGVLASFIENQHYRWRTADTGDISDLEVEFDLYFRTINTGYDTGRTNSMHVKVSLSSTVDPGTFCGPGADCKGGLICDQGFCSLDAAVVTTDPSLNQPVISQHGLRDTGGLVGPWRIDIIPWYGLDSNLAQTLYCGPSAEIGVNPLLLNPGKFLPVSGDFGCSPVAGGDPALTSTSTSVPLVESRDLDKLLGYNPIGATDLLQSCISELGMEDPLAPDANRFFTKIVQGDNSNSSTDFSDPPPQDYLRVARNCVSMGQWATAVQSAKDVNWTALLQLEFQQWLEVQTFVAREGLQENDLFSAMAGGNPTTDNSSSGQPPLAAPPSLDILVSQIENGWGWLFRDFQTFRSLAVADPDYRNSGGWGLPGTNSCGTDADCHDGATCDTSIGLCQYPPVSKTPAYEQTVGLAVTMIKAMTAHLDLVTRATTTAAANASFDSDGIALRQKAIARVGRTQRFALLVESIAATMENELVGPDMAHPGTCARCRAADWQKQWTAAVDEFQAARHQMIVAYANLAAGPDAPREDDLPLFFGDPTGTNSRYFASSDYLINSWADPAIAQAQSSLAAARDAWIAHANSVVQDQDRSNERAKALDDLKAGYGAKLIQSCGPITTSEGGGAPLSSDEVLDTIESNVGTDHAVDLDNCYIQKACLGQDNVHDTIIRDKKIREAFGKDAAISRLCEINYVLSKRPLVSQGYGYLGAQTKLETGNTDLACFFGSTPEYIPPPKCGCYPQQSRLSESMDRASGKALPKQFSECGGYVCQQPCRGIQTCTDPNNSECSHSYRISDADHNDWCEVGNTIECKVAQCDPMHKDGCIDPLCSWDPTPANLAFMGQADSTGHIIGPKDFMPDTTVTRTLEANPWLYVQVEDPDANGIKHIVTQDSMGKSLRRWGFAQECRIPVDYLYGYTPPDWGEYQEVIDRNADLWADATAWCASGALIDDMKKTTDDRYPFFSTPLPFPVLENSCFSGDMGQVQLDIQDAALKLQRVQSDIAAATGNLQDQVDYCVQLKTWEKQLQAKRASAGFWSNLTKIGMLAGAVAVTVLAPPAAPASVTVIGSIVMGSISASGGGQSESGEISSQLISGVGGLIQSNIDDSLKEFEEDIQGQKEIEECYKTYRQQLRDMAHFSIDTQVALNTIDTQRKKLEELKQQNQQTYKDGVAKLTLEENRPYGSYTHSYWYDEKVDRFKGEFEWARRLSYLALEAVEYEFQQSLPYRKDIGTATNPDQLETVIRGLKQEQAARSLNRRRPENSSIVLSLRDDILEIPDRSQDPDSGERAWTPAQRFMGRLDHDAYAYFAKDGSYLGQAVPFNLSPQGILETRCGERMWRVTATIQGDGLSDNAPNSPLMLLKRNTFSSQWCTTEGDARSGMQSASIFPSEQLFKPGATAVATDPQDFTPALMTPWFNIPRTDFYKSSYQDGSSEELAGRGLYGDYVLLFPKQLLDTGFPLDKVEDVLLRIDYLSVDNLSQ